MGFCAWTSRSWRAPRAEFRFLSRNLRLISGLCNPLRESKLNAMTSPETELISILGAGGTSDASGTKAWSKTLPEALPVLGLSDIVIFPGMVTPLLVESAQSIRLIDDVVAGDRFLALVLQRSADVENP